jgi:trans-aconitate methyltransferase
LNTGKLKIIKILFITTSRPAANFRLVKELECLKAHDPCTVICFKHQDWSAQRSKDIIQANPVLDFIQIDRKKELLKTVWSKLKHKLAIQFNAIFKNSLQIAAYTSKDKSPQLTSKALQVVKKKKVNLVIAHNLGAFYPTVKATKQQSSTLQLDIWISNMYGF